MTVESLFHITRTLKGQSPTVYTRRLSARGLALFRGMEAAETCGGLMRQRKCVHRQKLLFGIVITQIFAALCSLGFACCLCSRGLSGSYQFLVFSAGLFVWSAVVATNDKIRFVDAFALLHLRESVEKRQEFEQVLKSDH